MNDGNIPPRFVGGVMYRLVGLGLQGDEMGNGTERTGVEAEASAALDDAEKSGDEARGIIDVEGTDGEARGSEDGGVIIDTGTADGCGSGSGSEAGRGSSTSDRPKVNGIGRVSFSSSSLQLSSSCPKSKAGSMGGGELDRVGDET
jgi:hypothetical protein